MPDTHGQPPATPSLFAARKPENERRPCRVVGIGAGAGGLEAIQLLFAAMPVRRNLAFVICRQTFSEITDHLGDLLRYETTMSVSEAGHGVELKGDAIYLMPPKARMVVVKGRLVDFKDDGDAPEVPPLDLLFHGLAASAGAGAIALLLSGEGEDGLRGAVSVHRAGGLVLVQNPDSAEFPDRLKAVVDAGLASASTAPEAMPGLIERFLETGEVEAWATHAETEEQAALADIFRLLTERFGIDIEAYRRSMVVRRIRRRAGLASLPDLQAYGTWLASDEQEALSLHDDLMIGVTAFFRDPDAFSMLTRKVLPELVQKSSPERPIRVWVPACASGEEAYSLAMLIADHLLETGVERRLEILATDRCGRSLEEALLGCYHGDQLLSLPARLVDRYMEPADQQLRVNKSIRDLVTFSRHDLIREAPMTEIDLVSCRNLLIYLAPDARRKAIAACRRALEPEGFLFLGACEWPNASMEGLSVVERRWRIYRKAPESSGNSALKHLPEIYRKRPAETIQPPDGAGTTPYPPSFPSFDDETLHGLYDGMAEQNQQMLESTIDTLLSSNDALRRRNRDLREENQRLTNANTALEDMATMVAHDLKAPLRAVDHLAGKLERDLQSEAGGPQMESDLRHLQLRLVGLHRLIDDLLAYARQDATSEIGVEQVELGGLIREVLVLIGLPPGFRLEVRPPSLTVRTRRIPLECILRNLLDNAIKHHGGKKGALSIALHKGENGLDIRIEDDGRGLPAIDVEAGRQDGLGRKEGLGLAIVRQILAAEGSHLTLTPRSPGPGTDARLTWPIGSGSRRSRG